MTDVRPISRIRSHTRCPDCAHRGITRSAVPSGVDFDSHALWDLTESCIMCPWTKTTSNVKVGV